MHALNMSPKAIAHREKMATRHGWDTITHTDVDTDETITYVITAAGLKALAPVEAEALAAIREVFPEAALLAKQAHDAHAVALKALEAPAELTDADYAKAAQMLENAEQAAARLGLVLA